MIAGGKGGGRLSWELGGASMGAGCCRNRTKYELECRGLIGVLTLHSMEVGRWQVEVCGCGRQGAETEPIMNWNVVRCRGPHAGAEKSWTRWEANAGKMIPKTNVKCSRV